jgi:uncharacterized protein involved in outer membrane biogenesis
VQTTLLGLGIAIILAIVAALVAPFVVDWNHYRAAFETEASRLTGMSVRINGTIDARILPTPLITLRNVEAGETGQAPRLRAGRLELEVGLGPLLRGEIQASQVHLVAPQVSIGLDRSGAIDWPATAPSFRPEALSVSRFHVEDGDVTLTDAGSGSRLVLQKLSFDGDIRSLLGPFSGEGGFVAGGEPYSYRISGGRVEGAGGLKIRLGVDPLSYPLTTDIDGTLAVEHGRPKFEGALALARPAGAALLSGQRVMSDPWRAAGKIRATPAAVSLQDLAFQYGPDERPLNFSGKAELKLGAAPRLEGTVAALQMDVDRALADPDLTHRPPLLLVKSLLGGFVAAAKLPLPADVGVAIDAVKLGGAPIQSLHGTMHFSASGWSLNDIEFRAPGLTQVTVSGRLDDTAKGLAFNGPATLESADFDTLLAWLRGSSEQPSGQARTLSARGDVTIAGDRVAVDRLAASLDQENVEGRLAYAWAAAEHPATLDAELHAATLDLDALATLGKTAADYGLELPRAGSLVLDIGKATSAGVDARQINAHVRFDAGALQIDTLSVAELGGAALDVSGRIEDLLTRPRGQITLDLDARALAGLTNVVGKFAPRTADSLRGLADRLAPAKIRAALSVAPLAGTGSTAKVELSGQLGLMRLSLSGDATGAPSHLDESTVRLAGRLDADDGSAIAALFGLNHVFGVDQLPGSVTLSAAGPLNGDLQLEGQAAAGGFAATVRGALRLLGDKAPAGALQVQTSAADLGPLGQTLAGQPPGTAVALSARAAVAIAGADLSLTQIAATVGKASLHGRLNVDLSSPLAFDGDIDADQVDATAVSALLLGLSRAAPGAGTWSSQPLGAGAFTGMNGAVTFKLGRAVFTPALVAQDLKGVLHFHPAVIALDDIDGSLAGGHLTGDVAFRRNANALDAQGRIELAAADATTILAVDNKATDGKLTLKLQCDSIGGSPLDLLRTLDGNGTITVAGAHFSGLDASAFDAAMRAADRSDTIEAAKIQAVVSAAVQNGRLAVPQGNAAVTIAGGKVSIANATLPAQDGSELMLTGALDLATATIDLRATLKAQSTANALIRTPPELVVALKGPLGAWQRTLDTSALTSWLTLRAAELQARRLESIQANQRAEVLGPDIRLDSPSSIETAPPGGVLESSMPASASAAPGLGAPGFDRLQAAPPADKPIITHPRVDANAAPSPAPKPRPTPQSPSATMQVPPQRPPVPRPPAPQAPLDLLFRSQN